MKFSIPREDLLKPLMLVSGVVERKQTNPILGNVLIKAESGRLSITGTDNEVEMIGRIVLADCPSEGQLTVSAKKLVDICRSLPDDGVIQFSLDAEKLIVSSGRSRFSLSTLPATDFPETQSTDADWVFECQQKHIKQLIDATAFAMAQQDVRYYLNGMLWEAFGSELKLVATDGHRLALSSKTFDIDVSEKIQAILPRKGVMELSRLLSADSELNLKVSLSAYHIRIVTEDYTFTSKLVDGKFPDYEKVLPSGGTNLITADRLSLKQALSRVAILSNEKFRGVILNLSHNSLTLTANNPEQEEALEKIDIDYQGDELEIGFNISYLSDVASVLSNDRLKIVLIDANSSALLSDVDDSADIHSRYVVMPMRL